MAAFRFIHSSDLHLGRRFGTLPEDARGRLVEARHGAIDRLADAARGHGAGHILLAGDIFDTETPSDRVWRQALDAMAKASGLCWWLIPGNHDSLAAEDLWERLEAQAPDTIRILRTPEPVEIATNAWLLPAPVPSRFHGRDLTEPMAGQATPEGSLRIGLAHGGVQSFGSEDDRSEIIPPDRAETAGLDYLALGDWHGMKRIGDRTWYSGTPEQDRFKHQGRGVCLAVSLESKGAKPVVTPVETGQFTWAEQTFDLTPEQDAASAFQGILPPEHENRRNWLLKIKATGMARLTERMALHGAAQSLAPDFWHFEFDDTDLAVEYTPDDLDDIATGGALRMAADHLHGEAVNEALDARERAVAGAALRRLFSYMKDGRP